MGFSYSLPKSHNLLNISNLGGGYSTPFNSCFLIYFIRYQMLRLRHLTIRRAYSLFINQYNQKQNEEKNLSTATRKGM